MNIHHYSLTAPADIIEQVIHFYENILDLKRGYRPDFAFNGHWLYADDEPILHLIEDDNRQATDNGYFDHIALRCDDVDAFRQRLTDNNIPFTEMPLQAMKQVQLLISDPAGTQIELNFLLAD